MGKGNNFLSLSVWKHWNSLMEKNELKKLAFFFFFHFCSLENSKKVSKTVLGFFVWMRANSNYWRENKVVKDIFNYPSYIYRAEKTFFSRIKIFFELSLKFFLLEIKNSFMIIRAFPFIFFFLINKVINCH